ncbi:V-type ATP synthase subunit E [Senegalia massiliensis]|uniref:V-type ATP synthase subunit E n=1 Tax=Senegalia massiliensis TaxID=1720316 RepID=UPI0013EF065E|nr:V-type ATP synthase subunit E family protein [Senegalia massiliensis]
MITIEEKLNLFSKHVFEEIRGASEEKIRKIEQHNKEQMDAHRYKIEQEKKAYAEEIIKKEKEKNDKQISQKKGQIKKEIMLEKNKLFNKLIEGIKNKLTIFITTNEYKNYLRNILENGLKEMSNKSNIEVKISKYDIKNNKDYIKTIILDNGFTNVNMLESDEDIIGGMILLDKSNRAILDLSLLDKLEQNKEYIGKMLYEALREGEEIEK